jgi:hypothetical protein
MEPPSRPRLAELAGGLLATYRDLASSTAEIELRLEVSGRLVDLTTLATVWGLVAHVHHLAPTALATLDGGDDLTAAPLIRLMYEAALTAQWAVHVPGGTDRITQEGVRQRKILAASVNKDGFRDVDGQPWKLDEESDAFLNRSPSVSRMKFQDVCSDLKGTGPGAYAIYRLYCQTSHASASIADRYITFDGEGEPALNVRPAERDATADYFTLARSLVWAGGALDWIDRSKKRRSELKSAAKELATVPNLCISDDAWVELNKPAESTSDDGAGSGASCKATKCAG